MKNLEDYKKTVVTVTMPRFGCIPTFNFLKVLALSAIPEPDWDKKRWNKTGEFISVSFYFDVGQEAMANQFLSDLKRIFNPQNFRFSSQTINKFKDKWELFEYLLKNHDWNYQYSDDHRVWSSGESSFQQIKALRVELGVLDAPRAENLWNQMVGEK